MLTELSADADRGRVAALLRAEVPTRLRALAVLDGVLAGRVWVDDLETPRGALVIEDADGTVYPAGTLHRDEVAMALDDVPTRSGDLIFGFTGSDDPARDLVPAEPYWRGEAIDFTDRRPGPDEAAVVATAIAALPADVRVVNLDAALLRQTEWYEDTLHAFGSAERWEALAVGFGVLHSGALVAECLAGPRTGGGWLEMGVATRDAHRGRGYGTLVSRLVARSCEARGDRVWWNANAGNAPSIAIARRIGFRAERRYELVALRSPLGTAMQGA
jgi:RimJ/RimL family protein N-acetyltransferase